MEDYTTIVNLQSTFYTNVTYILIKLSMLKYSGKYCNEVWIN